jgi:uncharacterized protein YecT (DUF1311 family)
MKITARSLLFLVTLLLPLAHIHAQSQQEMNRQAAAEFQKADAELNKVYAQALAKLDDEGKAKLKAAQRAWIAFREAHAEFEADAMRGGSAAPLLRSGSLASTTRLRTKELKEFLKELGKR